MKKKNLLFLMGILSVCSFYACKKSSDSSTNAISGNYKFVSMHAAVVATNEYSDFGTDNKTVTTSEYTTGNNTGDIAIDGKTMHATNLSYSVSMVSHGLIYEDNNLIDSIDVPYSLTIPPTESYSAYLLSGTDSITFTSGGFISGTSPSTPSTPSSGTYSLVGGLLTLNLSGIRDTVVNEGGISVDQRVDAHIIATFQKK